MTERLSADYLFTGDVKMTGTGSVPSGSVTNGSVATNAGIDRSKLAQDAFALYPVPVVLGRVHDDPGSLLPGTSAGDDLGLSGTTFGTDTPHLTTGDLASAGSTTRYARFLVPLAPEYDPGETVEVRVRAGMEGSVADNSAEVDVEVFKSDSEGAVSGSDLVSTGAQDINSLTHGDQDFSLSTGSLARGDVLDIRVAVTVNDSASGGPVEAVVGLVALRVDIRG